MPHLLWLAAFSALLGVWVYANQEDPPFLFEKTFRGKIPLTLARLTPEGRSAFQSYRQSMNGLLR